MAERIRVLGFLAALSAAAVGCGGYGDETSEAEQNAPPLLMMQEVNEWLKAYRQEHGSVPATYEELKATYEATGKPWPPFTKRGTWVYFPQHARVIEVREAWAIDYLRHLSKAFESSRRNFFSFERAEDFLSRGNMGSPRVPGFKVEFRLKGTQTSFRIVEKEAGLEPMRENHTANQAFDIDRNGEIEANRGRSGRPPS